MINIRILPFKMAAACTHDVCKIRAVKGDLPFNDDLEPPKRTLAQIQLG